MAKLETKKILSKTGELIHLRSATRDDAAELLSFMEKVFHDGEGQVLMPDEFRLTLEQEQEALDKFEKAEKEIFIIAEHKGRIIGDLDFHIGKRARLAHVGAFGISVLPQWRDQGVGALLLTECLQWAKTIPGIEKINLRVLANNERAIKLYKKFGFREDGRKSKEIKLAPGQYVDDISMEFLF